MVDLSRYQSKKCQIEAWKGGHKLECQKDFQRKRRNAAQSSGNPQAWSEFAQWREYHHDSLTNAALAHYILDGPGSEADYLFHVLLSYRNDPALPIERKFSFQGCRFVHKDLPSSFETPPDATTCIPPADTMRGLMRLRELAAHDLQQRMGSRNPPRMGAYLLTIKFGPPGQRDPVGLQTFHRIFGFADEHMRANVNLQRSPAQILERTFDKGRKQRFCCGRIPGMPTCCCGGWTHQKSNTVSRVA